MANDKLSIELEVLEGNAEVVIGKNRRLLSEFVADVNKANPKLRFSVAGESYIDLDKLEKRAAEFRHKFEEVTKVRLDKGQIGFLSQEIVKTSERARQLQSDIAGIKKELLSPNRKTSIAFLTDELKAAEREADQLNRKLSSLDKSQTAPASRGKQKGSSGRRGSITYNQATFLELADDFAPQGLNRPFNAAGRAIFAAQNAKEAANEISELSKISLTTLGVFGAIAVTGAAIVKVTQNIREEAEKRLKVENDITAAVNKQILSQKELAREFAEQRANAARADNFSQFAKTDSIGELTNRKKSLEAIVNLTRNAEATGGKTDDSKALINAAVNARRELLAVEQRIREVFREKTKAQDDNFNQSFVNSEKSRKDRLESEKRYSEKEKAELEKRKQTSDKLLKLKDDFRDSLISLKSVDNPFVKLMSDFETATDRAREKYKDFTELFHSTEIADKIAEAEKANLRKAIGLQKFENNFEALKFRQDAQKLALTPDRQFADFQRSLERVNQSAEFASSINNLNRKIDEANFYANKYNPNNPKSFAEFNKRGFNDDVSDIGVQIRNAIADIGSLQNINLEGTGIYGKGAIADKILSAIPSREELLRRLNSPFTNVRGDADTLLRAQSNALFDKKQFEQQKFQDFLEDQKTSQFGKQFAREQIGLINNDRTLTDAQKAQRRLSVTDALGNDLDPRLKSQRIQDYFVSATAKENQAKEAIQIAKETRDYVKQLTEQLAKNGIKVDQPAPIVNVAVDVKDGDYQVRGLPKAPRTSDVENYYLDGGNYFERSKK